MSNGPSTAGTSLPSSPRSRPRSVTRVRLELMHWTGMRPSQMGRLRADDFRLDEPLPYVAVPRGKGGRLAAVPLVPEGRAFLDANAFGPWPRSSVNRAARRRGQPSRPAAVHYLPDPALVRRATAPRRDRRGRLLDLYGHTRPETTMIYAPPELEKHFAALERLRRNDRRRAPSTAGRLASVGTTPYPHHGSVPPVNPVQP